MEFWSENTLLTKPHMMIKVENSPLCITNTTKFLGVTLDNKLNWHDHIDNII